MEGRIQDYLISFSSSFCNGRVRIPSVLEDATRTWQEREGLLKDEIFSVLSGELTLHEKHDMLKRMRNEHERFCTQLYWFNRRDVKDRIRGDWALFVYRVNAFIDWIVQANADERTWAASLFSDKFSGPLTWMVGNGGEFVMLLDRSVRPVFELDRKGQKARVSSHHPDGERAIKTSAWPTRDDDSASLLNRDVLMYIYGWLSDPLDMRHFMMVNCAFHAAGEAYGSAYKAKIAKLLAATGLSTSPLWYLELSPRHEFFALCFVSCMSDEELECRIIGYHSDELRSYCYMLSRFRHTEALKVYDIDDDNWVATFLHASDSKKSQFYRIKDRVREILE